MLGYMCACVYLCANTYMRCMYLVGVGDNNVCVSCILCRQLILFFAVVVYGVFCAARL